MRACVQGAATEAGEASPSPVTSPSFCWDPTKPPDGFWSAALVHPASVKTPSSLFGRSAAADRRRSRRPLCVCHVRGWTLACSAQPSENTSHLSCLSLLRTSGSPTEAQPRTRLGTSGSLPAAPPAQTPECRSHSLDFCPAE